MRYRQSAEGGFSILELAAAMAVLLALTASVFAMLNPAIVFLSGVDDRLRNQFRCPNVQFCNEPLEMSQVARECDLALVVPERRGRRRHHGRNS